MKKFKIIETGREDYKYNVEEWMSLDNGETYLYAGNGRFCKTLEEVENYIESRK